MGNELLAMYEASSCEPVPVRLVELMNRLERTTPPDDRGHGRLTKDVNVSRCAGHLPAHQTRFGLDREALGYRLAVAIGEVNPPRDSHAVLS